jgi:hypothetical protein
LLDPLLLTGDFPGVQMRFDQFSQRCQGSTIVITT